jgi:hypothetical protein
MKLHDLYNLDKLAAYTNAIGDATPERVKYALELADRIDAMPIQSRLRCEESFGKKLYEFSDTKMLYGWYEQPLAAMRKGQREK